ncbi:probable tRNA-dihydrouridine synthase [Schistocerca gregaria]|uniref:probable tRNA-dihydrouridine synthase n=1 Tax=Schistocerca gregaria TaxID=7010 RepID=UPI00211E391B|nr:probable tRNA-dihydrouridine synthase [Schistocerca gregaria]
MAPLSNVTDPSFRRIIAKYGKPDVLFTEFVSAAGLVRSESRQRLLIDLIYDESERPIVAQLFGADPQEMYEGVHIIKGLGFDGVDINMGCPDRAVVKQGCGSGLIDRPELAQQIIKAAKKAADEPSDGSVKSAVRPFGVSIKTRIGGNKECLDSWLPYLLEMEPDALTLHLRTRKEQSLVPAHWTEEVIGKAVDIVKRKFRGKSLILGNGDVKDIQEAREKVDRWGIDGVMLGRAIYGNPWLFKEYCATPQQKISVLLEHTKLYQEILSTHKSMAYMKKHYKAYVTGFEECSQYRMKMMNSESMEELEQIADEVIQMLDSKNSAG